MHSIIYLINKLFNTLDAYTLSHIKSEFTVYNFKKFKVFSD